VSHPEQQYEEGARAGGADLPVDSGTDARHRPRANQSGLVKTLGLGVITGAADNDPSAIGTYASAGAKFGFGFLWATPIILPMMFTVVYLSAKLGQVSGRGLFHVIRDFYPRWILNATLIGVCIGDTIEAAADLGGIAWVLNLFIVQWNMCASRFSVLPQDRWKSCSFPTR